MSARSDILGWVIRRLTDIDAADPKSRQALFSDLREQVAEQGFEGRPPEDALPHLESAIARQDVYWLSQQEPDGSGQPPAPAEKNLPDKTIPKGPKWGWRRFLPVSRTPPGPHPGDAIGPFADHVYETVLLLVKGVETECRLSWTYDPACTLTADCADIGFHFETRAFSFAHAVEHLKTVLTTGGLRMKVSAFMTDATWTTDARDCETVQTGTGATVHAFSRSSDTPVQ
ncbi:MAG: hypothetical protein R3C13_01920 [Hyphomonas sp.]|uniref:hypothetical protein n=1 Tax=Hyphomonas sp. TaxID=87 RepID=UPI003527178E